MYPGGDGLLGGNEVTGWSEAGEVVQGIGLWKSSPLSQALFRSDITCGLAFDS